MADPAALRTRRYRAHRRGDHSLCTSCPVATTRQLAGALDDVVTRARRLSVLLQKAER